MRIKFWGTRGSIPVPGKSTLKFGDNTSCIEIYNGGEEVTILDAGSGIRELGFELLKNPKIKKINLLISHYHWDHIQGLPFFTPVYHPEYEINFYSSRKRIIPNENIFDVLMQPLFFPVSKKVLKSKINFHSIKEGEKFSLNGFEVETIKPHHSLGTVSYKLKNEKFCFVYMTDSEIFYEAETHEPEIELIKKHNNELISFCQNCDYLVHDSMYSLEDFKMKIGWGHSNNISASLFADAAEVKNLYLFHYDPLYSDEKIKTIFKETKSYIRKKKLQVNCSVSKDYMEIKV